MIGSATSKRTKPIITGAPSSEISPAAEVIANNVDLLTEILLRLPAKSLIRFKSVSKHWFSLISNSQFSITHSRRNPNPSISSWFFSSTPHEHSIQPKINHSCNGLLLIEYVLTSKHYFMVYNPTIHKYASIPEPTVYSDWSNPRMLRAYLDFDPSKSPHYKVVLLSSGYYYHNFNVRIDTYCSGSTSWKQIRAPRNGSELIHAAFSGGVLYWFSDENMLVGFDVDSEKMIEMPKAPKIQRADKIQYLGGCGGRLILILDQTVIKILEMDKNDGSWKIDCEFDLRLISASLHRATPYWNSNSSVLSLAKKEEGKGYELTVAFPREVYSGKVITYNVSYVMELKIRAPGNEHELIHVAFSGGVFYWFSDEYMLVGYDVDSEKMIEMANTPKIQRADRIQYFEGFGGRLILILDHMVIKILEMDKNDGSWKIDCEVDLHLMSALLHQTTPYWNHNSSVLSVVKKEEGKGYELIVAFPHEVFPGKVITYNLSYITEFKVWTVVCEVVPGESICDIPPITIVHPYIESLSPV